MSEEDRLRFEVLLEEIRGNVRVIAEGHGALVQRMERLDAGLGAFRRDASERFDKVDLRLDKVDLRLDQVDLRLDHVDQRLGHVDQRLDRIERHVGLNGAGRKSPPRNGRSKSRKK